MFVFFFQAEDGIRDGHVTGVQTCALPILSSEWIFENGHLFNCNQIMPLPGLTAKESDSTDQCHYQPENNTFSIFPFSRSEERRVGKECICQRSQTQYKMKIKKTRIDIYDE